MSRIGECRVNNVHHNTCFYLSVLWYCCLSFCSAVEKKKVIVEEKLLLGVKPRCLFFSILQCSAFVRLVYFYSSLPFQKAFLRNCFPNFPTKISKECTKRWHPEACSNKARVGAKDDFSESFECSRQKGCEDVPHTRHSQQCYILERCEEKLYNHSTSSQRGIPFLGWWWFRSISLRS